MRASLDQVYDVLNHCRHTRWEELWVGYLQPSSAAIRKHPTVVHVHVILHVHVCVCVCVCVCACVCIVYALV